MKVKCNKVEECDRSDICDHAMRHKKKETCDIDVCSSFSGIEQGDTKCVPVKVRCSKADVCPESGNVCSHHGEHDQHRTCATDCDVFKGELSPCEPVSESEPKKDCRDEALELIQDIAVNYDGYTSVCELKKLIDELGQIATNALNGKSIEFITTGAPDELEHHKDGGGHENV